MLSVTMKTAEMLKKKCSKLCMKLRNVDWEDLCINETADFLNRPLLPWKLQNREDISECLKQKGTLQKL